MPTVKVNITGDASQLKQATGQAQTALGSLDRATGGLKSGMMQAGIAIAGVTAVVATAKKAYDQTVGAVITYNKTILEASRATGMGIEAFSRMAEVAEDAGVSLEGFETALKMMTKRGIAPTIDSLAGVADKANAMAGPVQRAAYLVEIFGKNWASLNPLLVQGGQAMKEAAANIEDGIVVTSKEAASTERLRLNIEKLTDAWQAWKNEVGLKVTTIILDEVDAMDAATAASEKRREAYQWLIDRGIQPVAQAIAPAIVEMEREKAALDITASAAGHAAKETGFLANAIAGLHNKQISLTIIMRDMGLRGGGIGGTENAGIGGMEGRAAKEYARYRENIRLQAESQRRRPDEGAGTQGRFASDTARPGGEYTGGNTPNDNAWRAYWDMMASGATTAATAAATVAPAIAGAQKPIDSVVSAYNSIQDKTIVITTVDRHIDEYGVRHVAKQTDSNRTDVLSGGTAIGGVSTPGLHMFGEEGPELGVTDSRGNVHILRASVTRALSKGTGVVPHGIGGAENITAPGGGSYSTPWQTQGYYLGTGGAKVPIYNKTPAPGNPDYTGPGGTSASQQTQATAAQAVAEAAASAIPQAVAQGTRLQTEAAQRIASDSAKANAANARTLAQIRDILLMQGGAKDIGREVGKANMLLDSRF